MLPGLFQSSIARKKINPAARATGRAALLLSQSEANGTKQLLISDESLMGRLQDTVRSQSLYPAAGERTARLVQALGKRLTRIVLCIRSQDLWWSSAYAHLVSKGYSVPTSDRLQAVSLQRRTWRDVITDIACAAPEAELRVMPFESHAGRPDHLAHVCIEGPVPADTMQHWLNRSPGLRSLRAGLKAQGSDPDLLPDGTGRWDPFTPQQSMRLRENYTDDLHWLIAGADGLATLNEESPPTRADISLSVQGMTKGQNHEHPKGQLAQDG